MQHYDVAIAGLGIVGSAILASLSENHNIIGIDRYSPPHSHGSSHGENRIIRAAPAEGLTYARMAARSFNLFAQLEAKTGRLLLHKTGGIDGSTAPAAWAQTAKAICDEYALPYTEMSGSDLNRKYGCFKFPSHAEIILQQEFGHVNAELTWQTFIDIARQNNAALALNTQITHIDFSQGNIVSFKDGRKISCDNIILSAGSWLDQLIDLPINLNVGRRVLAWYELERDSCRPLPFCFVDGENDNEWYGMPSVDGRFLKIGENRHLSQETIPDDVAPPDSHDRTLLNAFIRNFTTGINPEPDRMATCKYTLTPDEHFIIDRHPAHENTFIFSCCSGHGFKYAPVYGEIARSLIDGNPFDIDLSLFQIANRAGPAP